jgi:hypothetical protein
MKLDEPDKRRFDDRPASGKIKIHENGRRFALENPGNIRDLLRMLDVELLPRIDSANMRVAPGFVGRDYRHLESDLVLEAPIRPAAADSNMGKTIAGDLIDQGAAKKATMRASRRRSTHSAPHARAPATE